MASNLKDRLRRIQELKKNDLSKEELSRGEFTRRKPEESVDDYSVLTRIGWKSCGYKVLKREVIKSVSFNIKTVLPRSAAIIIPDLAGKDMPSARDFIFFDLETSGLSGGAGTIAFLAAFGRLLSNRKISITQYLLLDYPGENDFINAVIKEFENENSVIVTFNGKCFDSQILKTRCLMNGIKPPRYFHADLLHPARRLWKNIIQDCSQGSIEAKITGIDRIDDIPGSLAPDIWFEFLKTGQTDRLMGICEHNLFDISGLAGILAVMVSIAENPLNSDYFYDVDRVALYWRDFCRKRIRETRICGTQNETDLSITGDKLLSFAADSVLYSPDKKAAVFRALAIDSEKKLNDIKTAIKFLKHGIKLLPVDSSRYIKFEKHLQRLENRFKRNNPV